MKNLLLAIAAAFLLSMQLQAATQITKVSSNADTIFLTTNIGGGNWTSEPTGKFENSKAQETWFIGNPGATYTIYYTTSGNTYSATYTIGGLFPLLKSLKINGVLISNFKPTTLRYNYLIPDNNFTVNTVDAEPTDVQLFETTISLPATLRSNSIKVSVFDSLGDTTRYYIHFEYKRPEIVFPNITYQPITFPPTLGGYRVDFDLDPNYNDFTNISYTWTFGNGGLGRTKSTWAWYPKEGTYEVCLFANDTVNNTVNSVCKNIAIGDTACAVTADYTYTTNDTSRLTEFTSSSINATYYYWDFGDGISSNSENPQHKYLKPGVYKVTLTVQNSDRKCIDINIQNVAIGTIGCKAAFAITLNPNTSLPVINNLSEGDITRYYWKFGDFYTSTDKQPSFIFPFGRTEVSLTVSNAKGTCVDKYTYGMQYDKAISLGSITLDVKNHFDKGCDASFNYFIEGNTVYFSEKAPGRKVNWKFGDGGVSEKHNPTHVFTKAGFYSVELAVGNPSSGCTDVSKQIIMINSKGNDIESDFAYVVLDNANTLNFLSQSKGDVKQYIWNFGDGTKINGKRAEHTFTKAGHYNVCHLVVSKNGNSDISCQAVKIEGVGKMCKAKFVCISDSLAKTSEFKDKSIGNPTSWEWNFGDNKTSTITNPTNEYTERGVYLHSLKISNALGCTSKAYMLANIGSGFTGLQARFGYDPTPTDNKATGYPVDFVGVGMGDNPRLKWDFGDGSTDSTTTNPTHIYYENGKYNVCYTVTDPITNDQNTYCDSISVTSIPTGTVDQMLNNAPTMLVYPMPFTNSLKISINVKQAVNAKIKLYDISGKNILLSNNANLLVGNNTILLNTQNLNTGAYIVSVSQTDGKRYSMVVYKK